MCCSHHSLSARRMCQAGEINVMLTRKQVDVSPSIDTDKPVSSQHEASYYDYYGFPYYWNGPYLWGPMYYPQLPDADQEIVEERRAEQEEAGDLHLRSATKVTGYHIDATDGEIGHVEDFIIDDETWEIRYMVVDARNWLPGKKVLIAPRWIRAGELGRFQSLRKLIPGGHRERTSV